MYRISKQFRFEAAHHLTGLPDGHQCARVHGHSYTVEIHLVADDLDPTGFVVDFAALTPLGDYLARVADHRDLNDLLEQPTSEHLAEHVFDWAVNHLGLPAQVDVERVRVSETARSWAEFTAPDAPGVYA